MELVKAIQTAIANPSVANVRLLLQAFDQEIAQQSEAAQFQTAGDVIMLLAQLIELRATVFLGDWEERHTPPVMEEPILTAEMLQDVLRQTMTLNLEDLLDDPERKEREASESIVGEVAKENLMQFLDQLEQVAAKQEALAIAYEENIPAWVNHIKAVMNQSDSVPILELLKILPMPFAQIWLALLLGDFVLEQTGSFYDAESILVKPYTSTN